MNEKQNQSELKDSKDSCTNESKTVSTNNNKGGKNNKWKGKGKKDRDPKKQRGNDPEWYIPTDKIAQDSAALSYEFYAGTDYEMKKSDWRLQNHVFNLSSNTVSAPGIAIYKYIPVYGTSNKVTSTLNQTANALYKIVRKANSGAKNYEPADMMLYIMALDQVYLMLHEARRIMQMVNEYYFNNKLIPEKLIQALGYDHKHIMDNQATIRAKLNTLISWANSYAIPKDFNIYARRAILATNIFVDDSDKMTQFFVPESDGYFILDERALSTGGCLIYVAKSDIAGKFTATGCVMNTADLNNVGASEVRNQLKMMDFLDFIEQAIGNLSASQDVNVISGDILKAYTESQVYTIKEFSMDERINVAHDTTILEQFKNSIVLDVPGATLDYTVSNGFSRGEIHENIHINPLFSSLKFKMTKPSGSTSTKQHFYSTQPVIYQEGGKIYFEVSTSTSWCTGTSMNQDAKHAMVNQTSVNYGVQPYANLLLDTYDKDMDYKKNLDYSRLMMATERRSTSITLHDVYYYEFNTDPNSLLPSTTFKNIEDNSIFTQLNDTIIHGTEIGLGWLVYITPLANASGFETPTDVDNFVQLARSTNTAVVTQWLQFGESTVDNTSFAYNIISLEQAMMDNNKLVIKIPITRQPATTVKVVKTKKVNDLDTILFVQGLDFGPRQYGVTNMSIGSGTVDKLAICRIPSGKFGNSTSRVPVSVVASMHDTAMLGLLAKSAFKLSNGQ